MVQNFTVDDAAEVQRYKKQSPTLKKTTSTTPSLKNRDRTDYEKQKNSSTNFPK